jgi:hypothetical protein
MPGSAFPLAQADVLEAPIKKAITPDKKPPVEERRTTEERKPTEKKKSSSSSASPSKSQPKKSSREKPAAKENLIDLLDFEVSPQEDRKKIEVRTPQTAPANWSFDEPLPMPPRSSVSAPNSSALKKKQDPFEEEAAIPSGWMSVNNLY